LVEEAEAHGDEAQLRAALDGLPLDPYAASAHEEFFAVASETFFTRPLRLQVAYPRLYEQLRKFYRQDPTVETATRQRQAPG
jgi:Mlc titration factor MtfA (ptsG expression regulator)